MTSDVRLNFTGDASSGMVDLSKHSLSESIEEAKGETIAPSSFGLPVTSSTFQGHDALTVVFKTKRVLSRKVDNHTVEVHSVRGSAEAKVPAGYIVTVDGRMRQMVEVSYDPGTRKATSTRAMIFDAKGRFQAELATDVSRLAVEGRLAVSERAGLRKAFGRLLRGTANLVLPDQLQAQNNPSDPCAGIEQNIELALVAAATNAVWAAVAAGACEVGLFWECPYVVAFAAAASLAVAAAITLEYQLVVCHNDHPECFSGGYGNNGSCDTGQPTGTGGGGGNPGGGTGSGPGGGAGGGSGGGGGLDCEWVTHWWNEPPNYMTYSNWECHPI